MFKLIVFDVDGTLVDTDDIILSTWKELIRLYKPKDYYLDDEEIKTFSGPPLKDSLKRIFPEKDLDFMVSEYNRITITFYPSKLHTFLGAVEVIEKLKKEHRKLAILSSKDSKMIKFTLTLAGFDVSFFNEIVSSDDVKKAKPDPEGLLFIMDKEKLSKDETLYVGDTEFDYYCAENCDTKVVMMSMKNRKYKSNLFPLAFCSNYNELYKEIKKYD